MINVVRRSILFSALERYGGVVFFLASTAILSRLLTPQEFGIYAVVNAITAVTAASFQEFGGANYLIQKPSLSDGDIRSAYTFTLCLSVLFAVALFALRDVAAWFFSEEGLAIGIAASALNFLISPFLITISTLLRRDMAFGTLACCNVAGGFITAAVSIALATLNYSFMAPIWGAIIGNAAVLALLIASRRDLRIFRPSFFGYRDVIGFGAYSSGTAIINVFYNLAPQLILARVLDFNAVGLYGRASNITQVFDKWVIQVLNPVILPAISAHKRAGGDLKRIYLNAIELIAVVQWPFLLFFALMADPIIWIWLGETWSEIVPLVRMLCIASLSSVCGVLDISCSRCSRFRARHSYFIFDLAPTIAICDFCRFIFWRASCRGLRTSGLAVPSYRCAFFRQPAPRNKAGRPYPRDAKKRNCYGLQRRRRSCEHGDNGIQLGRAVHRIDFGDHLCRRRLVAGIAHDQTPAIGPGRHGNRWYGCRRSMAASC